MNALPVAIPNQSLGALAFLNGTSVLNAPKAVQNGMLAPAGFTDLINTLFGSVTTALSDEAPKPQTQVLTQTPTQTQPGTQSNSASTQPDAVTTQNGKPAPAGFTDLISTLFGSVTAVLSDEAPKAQTQVLTQTQPGTQSNSASAQPDALTTDDADPSNLLQDELTPPMAVAAPPAIATDANIAQAMIRSMLGTPKGSPISSTAKAIEPKAARSAEKASPSFTLTPVATPVTVPFITEPAPQQTTSNANVAGQNTDGDRFSQSLSKNPDVEIATSSVAQPLSNAPVSFAAKLIPIATPIETQTQSTTDVVPTATSDPAAAPQMPARSHDLRFTDGPDKDEPITPVAMAAAASSYTGGFSHSFQDSSQQNATSAIAADAKTPTTFGTVAESMRSSDAIAIASTEPVAQSSSPVQSISMRISQPDMPVVDVQVSSRGGEIHVAVRTPDAQLESAMREDLGTLSNSLDRAGYRTEMYVPRDGAHELGLAAAQPASSGSQDNRESSHDQAHDQPQQNFAGRDSHGSANGRQQQGRQGQGQNQGQNQRFRNWIYEMEKQ